MNKKDCKRFYSLLSLTLILVIALTIIINYSYYKKIEQNNNLILSSIIYNIKQEYPDIKDSDIIHILNVENKKEYKELKQYGITLKDNNISVSNKHIMDKCLLSTISLVLVYIIITILIIVIYNKKLNNNIREITTYLKEINKHNYKLKIESNEEGELSILQNELYKTAIMLNEQSLINKQDKENLKDSLSDISHQLRTPLTSINLMIDNLVEGNLDKEEQRKLLSSINRKIKSTNFLIESLLKLSKFDANTITFNYKNYEINKMMKSVENNLRDLLDLKNIELNITGNKKDKLYCDYNWQIEAFTNIVKNCIEHSPSNSKIDITYSKSELLTKIIIKDYGEGMSDKDKKHIFDRFYKGENSSSNSIGIGMSLAKVIIEMNNGSIRINSKPKKGTEFIIKFLNKN